MKSCTTALILLLLLSAVSPLAAIQDPAVLFRENFDDLTRWKPFFFPNIPKHSTYAIEAAADATVLRAESSASASAIVYDAAFSVNEFPRARWRWKVGNLYAKADPLTRSGDDYPIRIYIMFEYDPKKAGVGDRIVYGIAKARFGAYPPHSSLSYVWSSGAARERIYSSPYTEKAKMVVLRAGDREAGTWVEESVNILEDYRKAFGTDPPARARIAIMNDSDNTGQSSVSWVDYMEIYK